MEASRFYTGSQNSGRAVCEAELGNFDGTDTVAAQQRHPNGCGLLTAPLMPAVDIVISKVCIDLWNLLVSRLKKLHEKVLGK